MEMLDLSERQVRLLIEKGWLSKGKKMLGEAKWTREEVEKFKLDWLTDKLPPALVKPKKQPKPDVRGS